MARKFIDASHTTEKSNMVIQDGTALTLTGAARVLYNDALNKRQLAVIIRRIAERVDQSSEDKVIAVSFRELGVDGMDMNLAPSPLLVSTS